MTEYIEPNKNDPEECLACSDLDDLCDWHAGVATGIDALAEAVRFGVDDPSLILSMKAAHEGAARSALRRA